MKENGSRLLDDSKENNKQIAKISVFITSVFVIFLSISYAFLTSTLTSSKSVVINAGVLDLVLEEENEITLTNAYPMYDEVGMIQDEVFNFKLINNTDNPTNYKLMLNKISTNNELSTSIVKYYLTKDGVGTPKLLSTISSDNVVDEGTIEGNKIINYSLRLWIKSSVTNEDNIKGKSLSYKVSVEVSQKKEKEKIIILGRTFDLEEKDSSSNKAKENGIYKTTENSSDVYYWKGNITDNHIIFGGYCFEMVRTTSTGGVKMIYDGVPVDGKCANTGDNSTIGDSKFNPAINDNAYAGYMYGLTGLTEEFSQAKCIKLNSTGDSAEVGSEQTENDCNNAGGKWATTAYDATHANVVDSTIKTYIDNWFKTSNLNTDDNLSKIEDAVYCNDRSATSNNAYGTKEVYYNAYNRMNAPSLECENINDRFTVSSENGNGSLTYPVGLLTGDEFSLIIRYKSDDYSNVSKVYWLLTPAYFWGNTISRLIVTYQGSLHYSALSDSVAVRPVISLKSDVKITDGDGTEENPYVVE